MEIGFAKINVLLYYFNLNKKYYDKITKIKYKIILIMIQTNTHVICNSAHLSENLQSSYNQ